jgi:signal transduction histidine kinase
VVAGFALVAVAGSMLRWGRGPKVLFGAVIADAAGIALATWQITALSPGPITTDSYFFSTITVASVTFGTLVWRSGHAALAVTVGLVLAESIFGFAAFVTGGRWAVDLPSLILWAVLFVVLVALESARKAGRRAAEAFERADASQAETAERRRIALLSTAVLHDTVLGDLTTLATTAPGPLSSRALARLTDTVALLGSGGWLTQPDEMPTDHRLALIVAERITQAKVSVVGDGSALDRLGDEASGELLRALGQCLDNVEQHSRAGSVEIVVMATDDEVSIMVNDDGIGFDTSVSDPARLGLRASVQARITSLGGRSTIWSTPGSGTSVLLTVPFGAGDGRSGQTGESLGQVTT